MSGTSIRRATTADLTEIRQLIADAYTKYIERIGRPPAPMTADYAAALGHSRVWVLERGEAIAGALVTEDRGDHLLLETVAVAPDCQGMGYGMMLLDRAERDAVELGFSEVRLYTNEAMTENLSFYPRHGYRETGRAAQDGFRRVYFSKTVGNDDVGDPTDANRGDHFEAERRAMNTEALADVYRRYLRCPNNRQWDELGQFVCEDVTHNQKPIGLTGYRAMLEGDTAAIPDLHFLAELFVADADLVACRLAFQCTPQQPFLGFEPTGTQISFAEHVFYRFREGKIAEVWSLVDAQAIAAQTTG